MKCVGMTLTALLGVGGFVRPAFCAPIVKSVQVNVDGDTDIPRILELFAVHEGDEYSENVVERGLTRLADSGKFLGLRSSLDEGTGILLLKISLVPRVGSVEARFRSVPGEVDDLADLETEVAAVVGLSPGDGVFPDQLSSIRERVLNRVRDRGYHQAKAVVALEQVESSPGMNVAISVDLGPRSRVKHLSLQGFRVADFPLVAKLFGLSRFDEMVQDRDGFGVSLNVPYDTISLDERVGEWNLKARAQGYYDFQLKISERERGQDSDLLLELRRGPQYSIQFHGNVAIWERALRLLITDRTLRLGVPLSIQEAESMIARAYEKIGYPEVTVTSKSTELDQVRRIDFTINEGRKLYLGNVKLVGVPESEVTATDGVVAEWMKRFGDAFSKTVFDEKMIRSELPALIARIRSMGFLDARVLEFRALIDPQKRFVNVDIPFQLGDKYVVRSLSINGNLSLTQDEMNELVSVAPGDAVDPGKIGLIRERLLKKYKSLGFLDAKILEDEAHAIRRIPETFEVDVQYTVDQGPLIRVGTPVLEGLRRTHDGVVLRELGQDTLKSGSIWTPDGSDSLEQRLLNLGIFGSVSFEPVGGRILERGEPGGESIEIQEKDLKISLTERPAGTFEFGPGFRTDRGVIGFAELNYRNLGGWNRSAQFRSQLSRRLRDARLLEQNYSFTYLEPYVFSRRVRLRFNTQYDKADKYVRLKGGIANGGYARESKSFGFGTEMEVAKNLRWIQNLYSLAFTNNFGQLDDSKGNTDHYRVATIGTTINYDNRDNVFNPTHGWMAASSVEYSSPEIGSKSFDQKNLDVGFAKFRQEATTYFRLSADTVVAVFLAYTKLWALGQVPLDNRPSLGGISSIRALSENALRFAQPDVDSQESYEMRIEYRQPMLYDFGIAYFLDMGKINALSISSDGVRTRLTTGMRAGIGFGFRYKTIVGPVSFDVAYNANAPIVNGKSPEDLVKFVFRIGAF